MADRPLEMLEAAETACGLDPGEEWGHRLRAYALLDLGMPKAAIEPTRTAISLAPESHHGYVLASDVELANRRSDRVWAAAMRALELAPDASTVHERIGRAALALGNLHDAELAFRTMLRIDANDASALNGLGVVQVRRNDDPAAMELFTRALAADASQEAARDNLAEAAHCYLWGRRLRLPRSMPGILWLAAVAAAFSVALALLLTAYILWFPVRAVRARSRWRRIPERSRGYIADQERRRSLDALATWTLVVSLCAVLIIASGAPTDPGPQGLWGWLGLATAVIVAGAALTRVVPRAVRAARRYVRP